MRDCMACDALWVRTQAAEARVRDLEAEVARLRRVEQDTKNAWGEGVVATVLKYEATIARVEALANGWDDNPRASVDYVIADMIDQLIAALRGDDTEEG